MSFSGYVFRKIINLLSPKSCCVIFQRKTANALSPETKGDVLFFEEKFTNLPIINWRANALLFLKIKNFC
jgi:hypothetical protein